MQIHARFFDAAEDLAGFGRPRIDTVSTPYANRLSFDHFRSSIRPTKTIVIAHLPRLTDKNR